MSEHLSENYVARYLKRSLSRSERTAAEAHLEDCEACRKLVSESPDLQAAFVALRKDLKAHSERGLTHLRYEQLEAYVDDMMSDSDREIVASHAERCGVCRAELRDLQVFRRARTPEMPADRGVEETIRIKANAEDTSDIISEVIPPLLRTSFWSKVSHSWRLPRYLAGATAVTVIAITVVMFTTRLHQLTPKTSTTRIAQSNPANGSNNAEPLSASQPSHAYVEVPEKLETPAGLSALIGKRGTPMGGTGGQESFLLVKPVGTFVRDVRPEFRWQALAGATAYRVGVFDADLKAIETSPVLTATLWKSSLTLQPGNVYLWQVTAVKGAEQVVAPAPPAPEAKFEIVDIATANELRDVESASLGEHFKLGRAYARAGLLDEAEDEFRRVLVSDSNYLHAQRFLAYLRTLRHS